MKRVLLIGIVLMTSLITIVSCGSGSVETEAAGQKAETSQETVKTEETGEIKVLSETEETEALSENEEASFSAGNADEEEETSGAETISAVMVSSKPADETSASEAAGTDLSDLRVSLTPSVYTYDDMESDLLRISEALPGRTQLSSLGETFDGRKLYDLVIGDPDAPVKIMFNASIHAREYLTTQLLMLQTVDFLRAYADDPSLLKDTNIHVIPMVNPDGVSISQMGMDGLRTEKARESVREIAKLDGAGDMGSYLRAWKSNAQGVDINRNFDALWEQYNDHLGHPSADHYKGESVGCVPESKALIDLTKTCAFARTVSYHTQGGVIYWYFGQEGELRTKTREFADRIAGLTGYPEDADYQNLDPAGYKDWAISKMGIPSLTIEVGTGSSPVDPAQIESVWDQNRRVWYGTLDDLSL